MFFWIGSWCNLSAVMIIGILVGKTGPNSMMLFYLPFIIIPLHLSITHLFTINNADKQESQKSIWKRPVDLLLFSYFIFATLFAIFRGLVVLESPLDLCQWYGKNVEPFLLSLSPAPFAKIQMLLYMFSYTPYYCLSMCNLLKDNCHNMASSSSVLAGASLSAQLTYIGASIHSRTPYIFRVPSDSISQTIFWFLNLVLALGSPLFARRCIPESDYKAKLEALRKNLEDDVFAKNE